MSQRRDDTFIELKGIVKRYDGVTALDDVDFRVKTGEAICLAGENGSGGESSGSEGGDPGSNGAAIRRTNGSIQVNISDPSNSLNGRGSTTATGVQ